MEWEACREENPTWLFEDFVFTISKYDTSYGNITMFG